MPVNRLAALLALCSVLPACAECPLIGCGPTVSIELGTDENPFDRSKTYAFELDLDGDAYTVTCPIGIRGACDVEGDGEHRVEGQIAFDARSLVVEISSPVDIAPEAIELYITADDEQIVERTLSPEYVDRPIGDDDSCGVCRSAGEPFVFETS